MEFGLRKIVYLPIVVIATLIGFLVAYLSGGILVPILIFGTILACLYSWNVAFFLFAVAAITNLFSFKLFGMTVRPETIALPLVFMAMISVFWHKRRERIGFDFNIESILFSIFIVYTFIVSYENSHVFALSQTGILQLALAFLGFFVVSQLSQLDKGRVYKYANIYLALGISQGVYGLICYVYYAITQEYLFGYDFGGLMFGQSGNSVTIRGAMMEANLFSIYIGMWLILLISLIVSKVYKGKFIGFLSVIMLLAGLVLGWTRSAWIGFILGMLFIAVIHGRKFINPRNISILFALLLIFAPIFWVIQNQFDSTTGQSGMFLSKIINLADTQGDSVTFRTRTYDFAWNHWLENPIFGQGYFSLREFGEGNETWIGNTPLAILHDTGIIGFTLFFVVVLSVFFKGIKSIVNNKDNKFRAYQIGLLGGLILLLFTTNITPTHTLTIFWIHIGFVHAFNKIKPGPSEGLV